MPETETATGGNTVTKILQSLLAGLVFFAGGQAALPVSDLVHVVLGLSSGTLISVISTFLGKPPTT